MEEKKGSPVIKLQYILRGHQISASKFMAVHPRVVKMSLNQKMSASWWRWRFILWDSLMFLQNVWFWIFDSIAKKKHLVLHFFLLRLNVSMDENCKRLAYMDFLSAFEQKAERKFECPPASPDAVRQIESLDSLSPRMALARMRELVTASASNLYKVKLTTTQFFFLCHHFLFQLITFLPLFLCSRHSWPLTAAGQGWSRLWNFVSCSTTFVPACQTNSTDTCWLNWSWTVRAALLTGRTSLTSFNHRTHW